MADYDEQVWSTSTPITPGRLNHMEQGIAAASASVELVEDPPGSGLYVIPGT